MRPHERMIMGATFLLLFAIEVTLAKTKPDALFFVTCVLIGGLGLRAYTLKRQGLTTLTVTRKVGLLSRPLLPMHSWQQSKTNRDGTRHDQHSSIPRPLGPRRQ